MNPNEFTSCSSRKSVENPSNIPSENAVLSLWMAAAIKHIIMTVMWMLFMTIVGFPVLLNALEIIYG